MDQLLDLLLRLDEKLAEFVDLHGEWVYGLIFLVVFIETGLVVMPFLPGDSLLFAVGALAATGILDVRLAALLLVVAAIAGDAVNYAIGHYIGPRIFRAEDRRGIWHRMLNHDHLQKAHEFFERYGGKAIVLGRFVPIIRTFVPFVAGCGSMSYPQFALYNVIGGLLWVASCVGAGYAFGNVPLVKANFEFVVIGIVAVSLLPFVWGFLAERRRRAKSLV